MEFQAKTVGGDSKMLNIISILAGSVDRQIESEIRKRLMPLGYTFPCESEFLEFCKKYVRCTSGFGDFGYTEYHLIEYKSERMILSAKLVNTEAGFNISFSPYRQVK